MWVKSLNGSNGSGVECRRDDEAAEARNHQRVAVGRRARDRFLADDAAGAGPILDHERLAQGGTELVRHDAGEQVGGAGGRERYHDLHRPGRPGRGLRKRGHQSQQAKQG